ncbi:MAG: hypothetical protein JNM56_03465 [Planctomycetia bacterium]|nr:hypothetical protein [Planctomycetia bacterium]
MRLTLRNLLAYLDDTLEPAQAKAIGQRLAENPAAQELVERIKRLLGQRKLLAPPIDGPDAEVDASEVAQYLDGSLPNNQLPEVEQILLNNDLYLTEVAACHQLLNAYLAQPPAVPALARKRMYGLVKQADAPERTRGNRELPPEPDDEDEDEDENELPDYLRDDLRRRRVLSLVGAGVLLVLLAVAGWWFWPRHGVIPATTTEVAQATDTSASLEKLPPPDPAGGKGTEKQPDNTATKPPDNPPDKGPVTPPEKQPDNPPEKQPIDQPNIPKPNPERRESVGRQVVPPAGTAPVLLRRAGPQEPWQRIAREGPVATSDLLLSLPGSRNDIRLESGVLLTLLGNVPEFTGEFVMESAAVLHLPVDGFDAELTLDHGRILLANAKPQGEARVRVRFLNEIWDVTLKDNQSIMALDLAGIHPPDTPFDKTGKLSDGPLFFVQAASLKGQTEVKIGFRSFNLPTQTIMQWDSRSGSFQGPVPLQKLPRWFTDKSPPTTQLAKDMALAINELNIRLANKQVEIAIAETRKEPRPASRVLAIRALGAIDDITGLLTILGGDKDPLERDQAVEVLRLWMGRKRENEMALYRTINEKMKATYTPLQAEIIMELLHLFPPDARKAPETYEKLISNLTDKKLAVRHLSYWHLVRLDWEGPKAIRYDPAGDPAQLEAAYKEWKKRIPDGKLPPPSAAK